MDKQKDKRQKKFIDDTFHVSEINKDGKVFENGK